MALEVHLQEHAKQMNEVVSVMIELEAMKAANITRASAGESQAYTENHFRQLSEDYGFGHNNNINKMREFNY
jgi:hypothetical protein